MKGRILGAIILLLGSIALGVLAGDHFFDVFKETVPAAVMTSFTSATAHSWFLIRGAFLGGVIFLWTLAAVLINESLIRWATRGRTKSTKHTTRTTDPGSPSASGRPVL